MTSNGFGVGGGGAGGGGHVPPLPTPGSGPDFTYKETSEEGVFITET